jgi:hypothetical protein
MKLMVYQERPDYLLLGIIENRRRNLSRTRGTRLVRELLRVVKSGAGGEK